MWKNTGTSMFPYDFLRIIRCSNIEPNASILCTLLQGLEEQKRTKYKILYVLVLVRVRVALSLFSYEKCECVRKPVLVRVR